MNPQETCEDDIKTQSLEDLPIPGEQSEETRAGQSFNSFGGFAGGVFLGGARAI